MLTDSEIIQAFKCCNNDGCENCPNRSTCCEIDITDEILNIISRQQAEIERLQNENIGKCELAISMRSDHSIDVDCNYCIEQAKAEAIKEFQHKSESTLIKLYKKYHHIANKPSIARIKRLTNKENEMFYQGRAEAIWECISVNRDIVKEMVGEQNG